MVDQVRTSSPGDGQMSSHARQKMNGEPLKNRQVVDESLSLNLGLGFSVLSLLHCLELFRILSLNQILEDYVDREVV